MWFCLCQNHCCIMYCLCLDLSIMCCCTHPNFVTPNVKKTSKLKNVFILEIQSTFFFPTQVFLINSIIRMHSLQVCHFKDLGFMHAGSPACTHNWMELSHRWLMLLLTRAFPALTSQNECNEKIYPLPDWSWKCAPVAAIICTRVRSRQWVGNIFMSWPSCTHLMSLNALLNGRWRRQLS